MEKKEEEFRRRLLATFKVEADEHLKTISSGLIELEETDDPDRRIQLTEVIYREAHSLKGASRAVNLRTVESACNTLEDIFGRWKQGTFSASSILFDHLHRIIDFLLEVVSLPEKEDALFNEEISEILRKIDVPESDGHGEDGKSIPASAGNDSPARARTEKQGTDPPAESTKKQPSATAKHDPAETVRISRTRLDSLMMQAEEMLSVKLKLSQRLTDLRDSQSVLNQLNREIMKLTRENRGIPDPVRRPDIQISGPDRADEKILASLRQLEDKLDILVKSTDNDHRVSGRMIDNLLAEMRKVLMFPFSTILESFPRLVRDLSRAEGKNVELHIRGAENEVDRRILEELKDPLIHLVRNSIDHGIEAPEDRVKNNKPPYGAINISVNQLPGNEIEILVSDDGGGIDLSKVRNSAVKENIVDGEDELTDREAEALIFRSGISTSSFITDLSGRGLGLAIVREKVNSLGGALTVSSESGRETVFRIHIPVTLATYRGILIRVSDAIFAVPTRNVERIFKIRPGEIKSVENKPAVSYGGSTLSYVYMGDVLEMKWKNKAPGPSGGSERETIYILVTGRGDGRIAFGVDRILNEQEILVKHLSRPLTRVRNIGGVTVLGSGRIVPILNVPDLLKSAVSGVVPSEKGTSANEEETARKSVLVAEDSITSRMLLKDILETAGFIVTTAVDGAEALSRLREGVYDLLVSDIDMPRMNGFVLTEKIRGDNTLKDLPVVLVTALKTREDRERGMEAGANAYIEKSTFTPRNLLDAVSRLV